MTISLLHHRHSLTFLCGLLATVGLLSACKKTENPTEKAAPAASSETTKAPAPAPVPQVAPRPHGSTQPVGPALVVVPGIGLSAIRFGATFETVERHMGAPCDIRTETRCAYVTQAVEFAMKDGVVVRMTVERRDRHVTDPGAFPEKYYGAFNGGMAPEIMLGLHQHVVVEEFGEPIKKEPLMGPDGQVEKHTYAGLVLEYDKIENGNTILAAMTVIPDKNAPPHPKAAQAALKKPAAAP